MKQLKPFYYTFIVLIAVTILLSACQPAAKKDEPPSVDEPTMVISSATLAPSSTSTEAPTQTETLAPTATKALTNTSAPTFTPTTFTGFNDARVYRAFASGDGTTIYLIVPGVDASYYGSVDGSDIFCETDPDQVNLLVCNSDTNLFGTDIKNFKFYTDAERTFLVYERAFSTSLDQLIPTSTPVGFIWPRADFSDADISWAKTPPDCPVRGLNLTCETEYRRYDDNSCRVGMTCYDSCGYYYSVDTIKARPGEYKFSGPCW